MFSLSSLGRRSNRVLRAARGCRRRGGVPLLRIDGFVWDAGRVSRKCAVLLGCVKWMASPSRSGFSRGDLEICWVVSQKGRELERDFVPATAA